jgi:hypothetical protein
MIKGFHEDGSPCQRDYCALSHKLPELKQHVETLEWEKRVADCMQELEGLRQQIRAALQAGKAPQGGTDSEAPQESHECSKLVCNCPDIGDYTYDKTGQMLVWVGALKWRALGKQIGRRGPDVSH